MGCFALDDYTPMTDFLVIVIGVGLGVMLGHMVLWLRSLGQGPVRLAIVRRYQDANGSYVGELYLHETVTRKHDTFDGYMMIGASLDTLPFDSQTKTDVFALDTYNDFLEPMPPMTVRVGTLCTPADNESIRKMVRALPRRNMTLTIQNRFIEYVM